MRIRNNYYQSQNTDVPDHAHIGDVELPRAPAQYFNNNMTAYRIADSSGVNIVNGNKMGGQSYVLAQATYADTNASPQVYATQYTGDHMYGGRNQSNQEDEDLDLARAISLSMRVQ